MQLKILFRVAFWLNLVWTIFSQDSLTTAQKGVIQTSRWDVKGGSSDGFADFDALVVVLEVGEVDDTFFFEVSFIFVMVDQLKSPSPIFSAQKAISIK